MPDCVALQNRVGVAIDLSYVYRPDFDGDKRQGYAGNDEPQQPVPPELNVVDEHTQRQYQNQRR